jgi:hypothetical protein
MAKTVKFSVRGNTIIIGTGVSGLVTGALLARAGQKVVVLTDEDEDSGNLSSPPFIPQMLSVGFERESPVDRIFNELGVSLSLLRRGQELFKKSSAFLQIVFPYFRFTLYQDRNETLDNLRAGFRKSASRAKALFDQSDLWSPLLYPFIYMGDLPVFKKGTWFAQLTSWLGYRARVFKLRAQKASDFCKESGMGEKETEYFNALSIFYTGQTLQQIASLDFLQALIFLNNEPLVAIKGVFGLRDLFLKIIKENKGEILSANPSSLHFEKNRIGGIEFHGKEGIGCDTLIWNPRRGGIQREEGKHVYQFYFSLDEEAIPPSMGDFLILKRKPERPFDPFNFLYLSLATKRTSEAKEGTKGSSERGLLVQFLIDPQGPPEDEKRLVKEIEERIIWLIPFAEKRLKFSGFREIKSEIRIPSYFPQEVIRKVVSPQKSTFPVVLLGKSFYYIPHPATEYLISPFLIKRGYDLANSIKTGSH